MTVQEEYFKNLSDILKKNFKRKGFAFNSFSNKEEAKKFIDYCVSLDAQNILINKVNRRAIRKDASSSEVVIPMTEIYSIKDDPDFVESNRQKWLDKFRDIYTGI